MDDLKQKTDEIEKARSEQPAEDTGKGDKPEALGLVDKANAAAERLEKANKKQEELLDRQQELAAKQQLAGRALGGEEIKPKTQEQKDQEDADKLINQFT